MTDKNIMELSIEKENNIMTGMMIVIICLYFLPYANALCMKNKNSGAILVLNLFLGWTFIGWVIALVWSAKKG